MIHPIIINSRGKVKLMSVLALMVFRSSQEIMFNMSTIDAHDGSP